VSKGVIIVGVGVPKMIFVAKEINAQEEKFIVN